MTLDKQFTKTEHRQLKMEQRELQTKTGAKSGTTYIYNPVSQMKMRFQEIRIIATGPCITNQLRYYFKYFYHRPVNVYLRFKIAE
jgi:hypothetical protein